MEDVDRVTDNVTRKGLWIRTHEHLGVVIRHVDTPGDWHWVAEWTQAHRIENAELAGLLDELDATFPPAEPEAEPLTD